jgi:L-galactose dehydrogenase
LGDDLSLPLSPQRQLITLGRTGLETTVAGLGCGGLSRLGLRKGGSMRDAANVVSHALDLGIRFIDTAKVYGTEPAVGMALKGRRDGVVISTKLTPLTPDGRVDASFVDSRIDDSLAALGLETIDVMHLHGVTPSVYEHVVDGCLPLLQRAQRDGKIRHIGISELWNEDLSHAMLEQALDDDYFDVIMVGCNMLNSSARRSVLLKAERRGVATLIMFAVRKVFADPALLQEICTRLVASGEISAESIDLADPCGFLVRDGDARTLTEAAYRYCRHLAGASVVLTGTSQREHLVENIASIESASLSDASLRMIDAVFGRVVSVTGEK